MKRNRRGNRLPYLVLLAMLCTGALQVAWPTDAAARVRDVVNMGDPTDGQDAPSPGPSNSPKGGAAVDLQNSRKPVTEGQVAASESLRYLVRLWLSRMGWILRMPAQRY